MDLPRRVVPIADLSQLPVPHQIPDRCPDGMTRIDLIRALKARDRVCVDVTRWPRGDWAYSLWVATSGGPG